MRTLVLDWHGMWKAKSSSRNAPSALCRQLALLLVLASMVSGVSAQSAEVATPTSEAAGDPPVDEPASNDSAPEDPAPAETELLFDPTEEISEDLSVSFPADI